MKYFVSWTHSDPLFPAYLPDTRMLISPPNVNQIVQVRDLGVLPSALILDSGAFQYHRAGRMVAPADVLARQLHLAAGLTMPVGLCHLDVLVRGVRDTAEIERRVVLNLEHARWLIDYADTHGLPANITPIGVIQGVTIEQIFYGAQALAALGYRSFALGSLAGIVASSRDAVQRRVEAALEAVGGDGLHLLGVSSAPLLTALAQSGVASADSGAPMHEASRGGLLYSQPFRRYKIASAYFREWSRSYTFAELLAAPLPCDCPICRDDPTLVMQPQGKRFINLRGVHNYYHLRRALEARDA